MTLSPKVILPIREFGGLSRLASVLSPTEREALSRGLTERAVTAASGAGLDLMIVTSSAAVADWARLEDLEILTDLDEGLSAAARHAVGHVGSRQWIILHGDLPRITPEALAQVAEAASDGPVLVPSQDGGTNVVAGAGPFPFSYGVGSFHRHMAAVPHARVMPMAELSIDIDTPKQLLAFPDLLRTPSLGS